jgi:citrate synthase
VQERPEFQSSRVYPQNKLLYRASFMRVMFSNPREEYKVKDVFLCALDRILIAHAHYEQNVSTLTVHLAGSRA